MLIILLQIVASLVVLYGLYLGFWLVVARFTPDPVYPESEPRKFAVLVCAKDEEDTIGALLDSLKELHYPKNCYKTFVVAHNCTDHTAEIAERHGAEVFVLNALDRRRKSDALKYGLRQIRETADSLYEYFAVFDADNVVHPDFLRKLSNGLATGADVASGFYGAKNYDTNIVTRLSGLLYSTIMRGNSIPNGRLKMPVNVYGSGFAAKMSLASEIEKTVTLVEDFEFSLLVTMKGGRAIAVPDALFYAEMPLTFHDAWVQRRRWSMGQTQCLRRYWLPLLKCLPRLGWSGFKVWMDLVMNAICVISGFAFLVLLVLVIIGRVRPVILLILAAVFCVIFWTAAVQTILKEHRGIRKNWMAIALFPLWTFMSAILAFDTAVHRDLTWARTPHNAAITIDEIKPESPITRRDDL